MASKGPLSKPTLPHVYPCGNVQQILEIIPKWNSKKVLNVVSANGAARKY